MSSSPPVSAPAVPQRTRGVSEIRATIAGHVRELIGEDDPGFTDDLIEAFRDSVGSLCTQTLEALQDGDTHKIAAASHQIKGSAGNVGLSRIAHDWHAVETAAVRNDPDLDRIVKESVATARHIVAELDGRVTQRPSRGRRASDR